MVIIILVNVTVPAAYHFYQHSPFSNVLKACPLLSPEVADNNDAYRWVFNIEIMEAQSLGTFYT